MAYVNFKSAVLVLYSVSSAVQRFSGWLEGCRRHEHLSVRRDGETFAKAKQRYRRMSADCRRKGRRIVELICGMLETHLQHTLNASSKQLRLHMATLSQEAAGHLAMFADSLKQGIVEIIREKTQHLFHPPYLFLGGLFCDPVYGGGYHGRG